MTTDCWCFAYGSNLNPQRKEARTGLIRDAKRACLAGYLFTFNKCGNDGSGKANIVADDAFKVWGVVYRCSPKAMEELDRYEGVPNDYHRQAVRVLLDSGTELDAVAYVARDDRVQDGLKPNRDYIDHILEGARHHNLPSDYIAMIEGLA